MRFLLACGVILAAGAALALAPGALLLVALVGGTGAYVVRERERRNR